jgi:hypothetical protein
MHPRERVSYSAIRDRKPLKLPDGLRLIVWPVLALEEWDMARPMARMANGQEIGMVERPVFLGVDCRQIGRCCGLRHGPQPTPRCLKQNPGAKPGFS